MARRTSKTVVRDIGVDARFNSELVQKLINIIMERGKKNIARTIVYEAMDILTGKMQGDSAKALGLFSRAIDNITPAIEVRARRVGGSVYQIPTEVYPRRARSLALRWLVNGAAERRDERMGIRLAHELLEASEGRGAAFKKKLDVHKMAEANRAFSHYS